MATYDWPSNLPQELLQNGFNNSFPNTLVRTQMDEGPDKVRRWGTAAIEPVKGQLILDFDEYGYLRTFYDTTLDGGAEKFNWVHPITKVAVEFRFVLPPVITSIGIQFLASLDLEITP